MRLILSFMIVIVPLMSSISILAKTKIDTIDNWQVYYNRKIIGNYLHYPNNPPIIIKKDKIKPNDFLKVNIVMTHHAQIVKQACIFCLKIKKKY